MTKLDGPAMLCAVLLLGLPAAHGVEAAPGAADVPAAVREAWAKLFPYAVLTKAEEKERAGLFGLLLTGALAIKDGDSYWKIKGQDQRGGGFHVLIGGAGWQLVSESSHELPFDALPAAVRDAARRWAGEAVWEPAAEAEKAKNQPRTFKVKGRLYGKTIKGIFREDGTTVRADKAPLASETRPEDRDAATQQELDARLPAVKQTVLARFKDAKIVKTEHKKHGDVLIALVMADAPGGGRSSTIEVTLTDKYNKDFVAAVAESGELESVSKHKVPAGALPQAVSAALKSLAPGAAWEELAEARKERGEKFLYKVAGTAEGKTIRAEVFEDGTFKGRARPAAGVE
ncbi:MAG: hypothetical protein NTW87_20900 [Planctomycetota bacterium]|nr:hypothetical protein [Planctomycetota bacterium]